MKKTRFTKSFIAILSASAMMALSSTAAFAQSAGSGTVSRPGGANPTWTPGSQTVSCDVDITATKPDPATKDSDRVYKVVVAWGELNFKYTGGVWNPDTHVYDPATGAANAGWDKTSEKITVTNHSNWGVSYTAAWAENDGKKNGVTGTLNLPNSTAIDACAEGATAAPSSEFTVSIAGIPTVNSFTLDTINVVITPASAT